MSEELLNKISEEADISVADLKKKVAGKMESLGNLISEEGAIHIVANELGVALHSTPQEELAIKELTPNMRSATFVCKAVKKYELRTFGDDGKVGNLLVGDSSGITRLTFWNDKTKYFEKIKEGDVLLVQNAYTKENNGRLEVHMGNSSHLVLNPEGRDVEVPEHKESQPAVEKKLSEITENDGMVSITATIVQLYDPRFFESCPVCNKRMRAEDGTFSCAEHGEQQPNYNYVMNAFVDDGSDNMRATLWKEQVQRLFDKTDEEVIKLKDDTETLEALKNECLGKIITARAKVKVNEAYQQKELTLYDIEAPKPGEIKEKVAAAEEKKPQASPAVSEEKLGGDDEELLSIDDLDEEL